MTRMITIGQWAAARELREAKTPPTLDICARAVGKDMTPEALDAALEAAATGEVHPVLLPKQLASIRQLLNGEAPTFSRVAPVIPCDIATLSVRAQQEEWAQPFIEHWRRRARGDLALDAGVQAAVQLAPLDPPAGDDRTGPPESRAERVVAVLMRHADRLIEQVERQGGVLTKPQLDVMLAMVRLADRFEPMAQREAASRQIRSDDEIAEILERIDRRIVELAEIHAERLVARKSRGGGGRARRR